MQLKVAVNIGINNIL
jgi:myo-inositol-1-phosphate synthase